MRHTSFFDGGENGVVHVDMTEPYCPTLRRTVAAAAQALGGYTLHDKGTYVCTEGPRFETPAEIRMFQKLGGDIVGMTNVRSLPGPGSGNLLRHGVHGHQLCCRHFR